MPKTRAFLLSLAGAAVAVSLLPGPTLAQDVNPAVKARQAVMQLNAFNLGILGAMAKGAMDYDAAAAQGAADNLVALAALDTSAMWVPGTDDMSIDGTRALPTLWDNLPDVMAKGTALSQAAQGMADAAGTDLASLQAAMGPLGAACGGCHKAYRAPE